MSCSTNQNKISLSAVRCGISKTTNKALGLMAANKDAITIGISAGSLGFAGKLAADEFRHANQMAARKVYAQKMWDTKLFSPPPLSTLFRCVLPKTNLMN